MPVIEAKELCFTYGTGTPFEKRAMENVSFSVEEGEFIGIIGHTGSGKSTLVQHCNGLLKPSSGQMLVDGADIWEEPKKIREVRFKVGLCFQYPEYQLFENTVYKDIAFGPSNKGIAGKDLDDAVLKAAEFVGLKEELLQKSPFELSGGEKRRAAIAGVLAMNPKVLILDEPTAGLDPKGRDVILEQIRKYQTAEKKTVLFVSHSMEDIARLASRVLVMNQGKVVLFGTVQEVFSREEQLSAMGLSVPQVTKVFLALKKRGFNVNPYVYTASQGCAEILRLMAGRGKAE